MKTEQCVYRTKFTEISFDDRGILWLKPDKDADLDLEEVMQCFEIYGRIGVNKDNKVLQVIDARTNVTMDKEGKEYAAVNGNNYFLASAIISDNLSVRLIVNFFNLFYKNRTVPFRLFGDEESAIKWLLKYRQ
jgi:hypothetical protein